MQQVGPVWRAILLIVLGIIEGCHAQRPNFMTRAREDCAAGQQWACDLLDALSGLPATDDDWLHQPELGRHGTGKGDGIADPGRSNERRPLERKSFDQLWHNAESARPAGQQLHANPRELTPKSTEGVIRVPDFAYQLFVCVRDRTRSVIMVP